MYKIQEVVHKFRSGGTDKKDSSGSSTGRGHISVSHTGGSLSSDSIQTISTGSLHAEGSSQANVSHKESNLPAGPIHTISSSSLAGHGKSSKREMPMTEWYVPPLQMTKSQPESEVAELSSLPVITSHGLQQTVLAALKESDPHAFNLQGSLDMDFQHPPTSPDRKLNKMQPKGTIEYKVKTNDTIEKIAARFDTTPSELKKLNRMTTRMVFENQVLYIPDPDYVPSDNSTPEQGSPPQTPVDTRPKIDIPIVKMVDKPPAQVPGRIIKVPSPPPAAPAESDSDVPLPHPLSQDEARKLDEECHERFIKVGALYISERLEHVSGTLLVTPNAIMFDPDVLDENVLERGMDEYGVMVYMDTIMSAALYHDLPTGTHKGSHGTTEGMREKPEMFRFKSRERSASTSALLTSRPLAVKQSINNSKSLSGLIPLDSVLKVSHSGASDKANLAGLSPFFNSFGESSTDTETSKLLTLPAKETTGKIEIVGGKVESKALVNGVDIGIVAGESSTDDVVTTHMTFDLESLAASQNLDSSKVGTTASQENLMQEQDSFLAAQSAQGRDAVTDKEVKEHLSETEEPHSEQDIHALLAGARRDSLNAEIFYPAVPVAETSVEPKESAAILKEDAGRMQISDALVKNCADKLVAEILESVSLGVTSGSGTTQPPLPAMPMQGKVDENKKQMGNGEGDGIEMQKKEPDGEKVKIGDVVCLPVEKDSGGQLTACNAGDVCDGKEEVDGSELTSTTSQGQKSDVGSDSATGSSPSPSQGEGARARSASDSLSPLRTPVQTISNFFGYATNFFRGSADDRSKDVLDIPLVREGSPTPEKSGAEKRSAYTEYKVKNAMQAEERPELFCQIRDLITPQKNVHKEPPIYLHLHVDEIECNRRVKASTPCELYRSQTTKPHYWFSVPFDKADHLYAFFTHWRPEIYGDEDISPTDQGFVVVNKSDVEDQAGSLPFVDDYFGQFGSSFKKDWEIISREEARRRGSLAIETDNTMPELSHNSSILTQTHILQLEKHLPARTIGYNWSLVYSTNLHGFSLKRLYREVGHIDSPILLVLKDADSTVFGAFLSDPPKLSDHFYGTGICLLWTFKDKFRSFSWTGENAFFIKGDENSMTVGASHGVYGLWLDGDLNHGRSQECSTFNNIVLSASEDFSIIALEAWAFISDC